MKRTLTAVAVAIALASPAFAQEVSVGTTNKDSTFANAKGTWALENKVEAVAEARLSSRNNNVARVGLQRELFDVGGVTFSGRMNVLQGFGKTSWTGYSVEPSLSFSYDKADITVGYEIADSFASRHHEDVDTAKVTVMYPFNFGTFGFRLENERGERKQTSLALVYSLNQ